MAESVAVEQADLSVGLTSPAQKRKRATETASPDSRRAKRGAPTAAMSNHLDSTAFLDATDAPHLSGNISADFTALQRAAADHPDASDPANASSTAAAALGSMYPTMHVPQPTEETFAAQAGTGSDGYNSADVGHPDGLSSLDPVTAGPSPTNGIRPENRYQSVSNPKPAVGSEEWHMMRKNNHKEVERRRRETINEGINELAKIVPGCEKNKGSILARAVAFIGQLKENETQNIEKWTLEKLLTEQAINELSTSNDKLKTEVDRLYGEVEAYKRLCDKHGLRLPAKDEDAGPVAPS